MRYYDRIEKELSVWNSLSGRQAEMIYNAAHTVTGGGHGKNRSSLQNVQTAYSRIHAVLVHENTKRVLFDSRQASEFAKNGIQMPASAAEKIQLPFDQFYLEFTEPITLALQEPGFNEQAHALLIAALPHGNLQVTMFLQDKSPTGEEVFVDRSWFVNPEWKAFSRATLMKEDPDPSIIPYADGNELIVAGEKPDYPDRHIGWWERVIEHYTTLVQWIVVYMMAKSIEIVEEPLSRSARRRLERQSIPNPWHIVRVEPRFVKRTNGSTEDVGSSHGYRYDVMGHLRFKTNGTVEWVRPHQRGLQHELYIPKVSNFEGGKIPDERISDYFEGKYEVSNSNT
jgi:hypothetical protein